VKLIAIMKKSPVSCLSDSYLASLQAPGNSRRTSGQLLRDSRIREQHLRVMAHKILSAIEAERHQMSLQLNDEIAQSLLGINIRILALKQHLAANHADLGQEIAATRRLVEDSTHIISRLTHEFSNQHAR